MPSIVVYPDEEDTTKAVPEVVWDRVLPPVVPPAVLEDCVLALGVVSSTIVVPAGVPGSLLSIVAVDPPGEVPY